jgi:tetratricopeptide (TPR) repeat protein
MPPMPQPILSTATMPKAVRGKVFVFTGKLASMARTRAHRFVEEAGGVIRSAVSRNTHYLVVGEDGWPLEEGEISRKLQAGQELREHGSPIEILAERQWLDLLGLESKYPLQDRFFTAKACSRLLKISAEQIRAWRRLKLIEPVQTVHSEELFSFQDLKTLRTLNDLVARGVRPAEVRDLLKSLSGILVDIERPLAQLTVLAEQGGMVVCTQGERLGYGGQLWLDFDGSRNQGSGRVLSLQESRSPWDLYWDAEQLLADPQTHERGVAALQEALAMDPDFADVYCLMGNLHFAEGRLEEARALYEKALEIEPDYAEVWHNLGHIFDRYSNWLGAVRCYEKAVECDAGFDSAHFNLALMYEEAGDRALAERHWAGYLETAGDPEWMDIARGDREEELMDFGRGDREEER